MCIMQSFKELRLVVYGRPEFSALPSYTHMFKTTGLSPISVTDPEIGDRGRLGVGGVR